MANKTTDMSKIRKVLNFIATEKVSYSSAITYHFPETP